MNSLDKFLAGYIADLEADNKRFIDLMFHLALNVKIDLTSIDRIVQGIEDDQPRVDKWCEIMAQQKQDEEDKLCCVCYDREADQPLKCSHKLCPTCYDKLTTCPLCRTCYKEREAWTMPILDQIRQGQGLLDLFITVRNNRFVVCFRTQWICQEWLLDRNIVNYEQPYDGNMIELFDIEDVIDLMEYTAMISRRVEMILSHPLHRVVITNQENGRFKAEFTTLRHALNLQAYIGRGRSGYSSNEPTRHVITDIPCLSELMSFLSLPFRVQAREPS